MKKRLLCLVLAMVMLLSIAPIGAFAEGETYLTILYGRDSFTRVAVAEYYLEWDIVNAPSGFSWDDATAVWTVGDESIARVTQSDGGDSNYLQGLKAGNTTLTLTVNDTYTKTIPVTITPITSRYWKGNEDEMLYFNQDNEGIVVVEYRATASGYCHVETHNETGGWVDFEYYDQELAFQEYYEGETIDAEFYVEKGESYYFVFYGECDNAYLADAVPVTVTLTEAPKSDGYGIFFEKEEITLEVGESYFVGGELGENEEDALPFTSDNTDVAIIEDSYIVVGVAPGTAIITGTSTPGGRTDTLKVTVVPASAPAAMPSLVPGQSYTAKNEEADEGAWYSFTPTETAKYTIASAAEKDVIVYLYDADMEELDYDDDDGFSTNFWLTYELTAGKTYYYKVRFYNETRTGDIPFAFGKATDATDIGVFFDGDVERQENTLVTYFPEGGVGYLGGHIIATPGYANAECIDTATSSDEDVVEVTHEDEWFDLYPAKAGTATITITTENGLTETFTLKAVEAKQYDFNQDQTVNQKDIDLLRKAIRNEAELGFLMGMAERDGNQVVNEADIAVICGELGLDYTAHWENPTDIFTDVKAKDWFIKNGAVEAAYNFGLFAGTSKTTFGPNDQMTRGMFVTVLGRLQGVDTAELSAKTKFTDVKKNQYYAKYVGWAADNGIVSGLTNTTFGPNANITREQICAIMVRYCDFAGITLQQKNAKINFTDASSVSGYARSAVTACQRAGLVSGEKVNGGYRFRPQGNATRAEVATILTNFMADYFNN